MVACLLFCILCVLLLAFAGGLSFFLWLVGTGLIVA
jgi:hypothetical protein